jgi:hypothetical protein
MKEFITEFGMVPSALDPLVMYRDNTGVIPNAREPREQIMNNIRKAMGVRFITM